jgi:hypothetical protein
MASTGILAVDASDDADGRGVPRYRRAWIANEVLGPGHAPIRPSELFVSEIDSGPWTGQVESGQGELARAGPAGETAGERSCRLGMVCHHARSYSSGERFNTCTLADRLAWRTRFLEPKCFSAALKRGLRPCSAVSNFQVFFGARTLKY